MTGAVVSPRDDCWTQWLSVSEETLFLHDGLLRVAELVELPRDVSAAAAASDLQCGDQEVVSFDSRSPTELSEKLRNICGSQNSANARLLEFRLNALKGFWNAIQHVAGEVRKETAAMKEVLAKRPTKKEAESGGSFSTQVSLLLVLPLLQSHSRLDSSLCGITANLLLKCLRDCIPLSLAKEPSDCLDGLESLLSLWLGETALADQSGISLDGSQRQTAAVAMVALACARGSLATFVHTAHLLQSLSDIESLPVGDILEKLVETEWGQGHLTSLLNTHHVISWGFDDLLYASSSKSNSAIKAAAPANTSPAAAAATVTSATDKGAQQMEIGRSMACDGKFCYISNSCGKGIIKVGIGLHGTLRGYVYARNMELPIGWLACSEEILLHRPQVEFDGEDGFTKLANMVDRCTLQTMMTIDRPAVFVLPPSHGLLTITVNLLSDGVRFYWIWTNCDKNSKIFMDVFTVDEFKSVAVPVQDRVLLQKKDDTLSKVGLESAVSRLRVFQPGGIVATMTALTPTSDSQTGKKEDASGSSVGLLLKNLVKTPMFCDGNTLVMLFNPLGGSLANTARSLFGSGANVNSARVLAVNNCFCVADGQFITRFDLCDAPNSAISKMSSISGIGVCFDASNNLICCSTSDFVDQFLNPGRLAKHLVLRRLGLSPSSQSRKKSPPPLETNLSSNEVIRCLLQHVGCMYLHELCGCSNNNLSGLSFICLSTDALGYSDALHLCNLSFVCDIMESAMAVCDELILTSCLILVEYLFQLTDSHKEKLFSAEIIIRLRMLIWRAFDIYRDEISCGTWSPLKQICQTITSGLCLLYPTDEDRRQLLERVIMGGEMKSPAFAQMRQLLLVDFANQLKNPLVSGDALKQIWLKDELLDSILMEAVNDSFHVIRLAKTSDRRQLEKILASVPVASPCLSYLLALEVSVLKQLIMIKDSERFQKQAEDQDETVQCRVQSSNSVHELRSLLLDLVSKVFAASIEVLKVLVETCDYIIGIGVSDLEFWMQSLERLTKATLLGQLLPLLVTAMTEKCLQCLMFAENLMSKIVQLVILSSRVKD